MKSKAVILLRSQPPHMGEFLQIKNSLNKFDFLYICVDGREQVIPLQNVSKIWNNALEPYLDKIKLMYTLQDFQQVMKNELPSAFKDCTYLTADRATFVHLSTLGIKVELIPRAMGYNSVFLQVAYRQSQALDYLEQQYMGIIPSKR